MELPVGVRSLSENNQKTFEQNQSNVFKAPKVVYGYGSRDNQVLQFLSTKEFVLKLVERSNNESRLEPGL